MSGYMFCLSRGVCVAVSCTVPSITWIDVVPSSCERVVYWYVVDRFGRIMRHDARQILCVFLLKGAVLACRVSSFSMGFRIQCVKCL